MNAISSTRSQSEIRKLPLSLIGAILTTFVALWLSENRVAILPMLAITLVSSWFVPLRFRANAKAVQTTRVALFALVAISTFGQAKAQTGEVSPLFLVLCCGPIAACEIVICAWSKNPWGGVCGEATVFLSGLTMAAGGATFRSEQMRFLVPLYFFFLLLWLVMPRSAYGKTALRAFPLTRVAIAIFAIGLGALSHFGVQKHVSELNEWGNKFFEDKPFPEPTGLSTTPRLGSRFGNNGDALTRVVTIRNLGDEPHLRAMSFDTYRDGRWFPVVGERDFERVAPGELKPNETGRRAVVTRWLDDDGIVLAPLSTGGFVVPFDSELEWSTQDRTPLRSLDSLQHYELILPDFRFVPNAQNGISSTRCSPEEKTRCLLVPPEIDARVVLAAQQIAREIDDPREKIEAVIGYLQQKHKYSTRTTRGAGDPVSNFLLERKSAHCEYFASAATILLRCMNVPTRYVIGYYAHENDGGDRGDDITTVRLRDAHAWAESWIDGVGWVTVEATPASGLPNEKTTLSWNLRLREKLQDWLMSTRHWLVHFVAQLRLQTIAALLCIGFLLIFAIWAWRRRVSSTRSRFYGEPDAPLARLHKSFAATMKKRGVRCAPHQSWRECLQGRNETESAALLFVERYERARFSKVATRKELDELNRFLTKLRKAEPTIWRFSTNRARSVVE